ncbi:MAG: polysaccharide biosynthesis tyrosine autokinase [Luteitalea sp.]|nr:polysaccharide biosynthesis tyrosine autokinase [Luteitalea sp.]
MADRSSGTSAHDSEPAAQNGTVYVGPQLTSGEGFHLLDHVRVLYKRRGLAAAIFLVVMITVTWVVFAANPIYEARVQLLIENENRQIVLFKEVIEQQDPEKDYQQTQHRILQSRSLARSTLDRLQLWDHPDLAVADEGGGGPVSFRRLAAWVKSPFGSTKATAVDTDPDEVLPAAAEASGSTETAETEAEAAVAETPEQAAVLDAFLNRLTVTPVRNSSLVDVKVQSLDPVLAAQLANGLAAAYIAQTEDRKQTASRQASVWLSEQLQAQRKQVEDSEVALQRYRESNDAMSLEEPNNIVVQKLTELNATVTKAKTDRIGKEEIYRRVQAVKNDPELLNSIPQILSNTYVQQLKAELILLQREELQLSNQLGDRNPELIKLRSVLRMAEGRLASEVDKIVLSLQSEYESSLAQEQSLVAALEAQKAEALALNRKGIDYGALQREATSNRQIFETLLQRARETGISGGLATTSNIQVVDSANIPRAPVWPRKQRSLLLAALSGAVLAVGFAFFVDYLDTRLRSPEDFKKHLGLPFLGLVPLVPAEHLSGGEPLINSGVPPTFAEAFRAVRTSVLFSSTENSPRTLMVTSTGPNEGKTTVAANLAIALAQAGQQVVLIDADLRRPRVHTVFGQPQEPGLSNVLTGLTSAADALRTTNVSGMWLLPAGSSVPNPADLLGSARFKTFLQALGKQCEWVIIDSPPVLAVTDASLIAHLSSGVLFVVGADKTNRHAAQAALERLDAARAPFLGGVLNLVDLNRHAYYFAKYYRHEYARYYSPNPAA